MAFSSDIDPATEALIAQLLAEDLAESYDSQSLPIGSSYHDYEEPLSSYERQCLDAENDPDGQGDEGSGWGPEYSDGIIVANAPDETLASTEPAGEGTWNSRFIDDDGQVRESIESEQASHGAETAEDDNKNGPEPCPNPANEGLADSQVCAVSSPACNIPTTKQTRSISSPLDLPTQTTPGAWLGPIQVPHDHIDPSDNPSRFEPSISPNPSGPNEQAPALTGGNFEDEWDDGLDYSFHKGKGKAVRAYDEFKLGLRNRERESRHPTRDKGEEEGSNDDGDDDDDSKEEGEADDEDLPFIRIPWPTTTERDEILTRREDSEVVEIHVGDDETLESILRDISLRDERRRKGKGIGVEEVLGGWW